MSADQSAATAGSGQQPGKDPAVAPWREIWQVPTLGLSIAVLVIGLAVTALYRPAPDYASLLDAAERRIVARRFVEALDGLNGKLSPLLGRESFTTEYRRRFHTLRARALALGQAELGIRQAENDRNIVAEYREAERRGAALDALDAYQLGLAYLGLGDLNAALKRAEAMPATERHRRHEMYRLAMAQPDVSTPGGRDQLVDLVSRFVVDPTLGIDDRAWAEVQRARVLAATGDWAGVVDRLLRTYPQWAPASPAQRAALSIELGAAHLELGELEPARVALELGDKLSEAQSPERGQAIVLLGRLDELAGRPLEARERYQRVLRELGWSATAQAARLGLGEVYAADGEHDLALDLFQSAIDELHEHGAGGGVDGAVLENALLLQYQNLSAAGQVHEALRYARMAERAHAGERSAPLVLALADANRALAEATLREAGIGSGPASVLNLDAATREEVRLHMRSAGGYYALHADMVTLDEAAFERSTWLSALSFDQAGDLDLAEQKLMTFVTAISESPLRAEARYRLGRAYQVKGRHSAAEEMFRGLIEDANNPDTGKGVGPFALMSYVPLAQTLMADANLENDREGLVLLERVLSGGLVGPTSEEYRTALLELGTLHYRQGEYVNAIERLREALTRYEGERPEAKIRYTLADAYRLEAARIASALTQAMPGSERRELQQLREDRLRTAIEQYELARAGLESLEMPTPAERESLRGAYFFLGACAYDLEDYDLAVRQYAAAHAKYSGDPASFVPLIQIVSARLQQGELGLARAANERAQRLYESYPEEVWANTDLPLTRADWQRWFQASERLATVGG